MSIRLTFMSRIARAGVVKNICPALPSGGFWNQEDFTGAMLKLTDVMGQHHEDRAQWQAIKSFMQAAIVASKNRIGI